MTSLHRTRTWTKSHGLSIGVAILVIVQFSILSVASDSAPKPASTVVAAQRCDLLDKNGGVVACISGEGAPWAQVSITIGENPMAVASLSGSEQGMFVMRLYDRAGKTNAAISLGGGSGGEITLFEPNGKAKASMGLNAKGEPSLKFLDKEGRTVLELPKR